MKTVYRLVVAALCAALIHIVMVLYIPYEAFRAYSKFDVATRTANQLVVLPSDTRRSLLPSLRGPGVAAYCNIDLTKGPVSILLQPPATYWSLSVFSRSGRQLYALNERQADTAQIAIDFKRSPSLLGRIMGTGTDEDITPTIDSAAWNVELSDAQAYAVMWIPYADPGLVKLGEEQMKSSSCSLKKA
jgi:hypothetical protein